MTFAKVPFLGLVLLNIRSCARSVTLYEANFVLFQLYKANNYNAMAMNLFERRTKFLMNVDFFYLLTNSQPPAATYSVC